MPALALNFYLFELCQRLRPLASTGSSLRHTTLAFMLTEAAPRRIGVSEHIAYVADDKSRSNQQWFG